MEERIKIKVYEPDQHRYKFQPHQLEVLNEHFRKNPNPGNLIKKQLAEELDIPLSKVQVWFNNRKRGCKPKANKPENTTRVSKKFTSISDLIHEGRNNFSMSYPPQRNRGSNTPTHDTFSNGEEYYSGKEMISHEQVYPPILKPKDLITNNIYFNQSQQNDVNSMQLNLDTFKPHLTPIKELEAKGLDSSPLSI
ncbi:hypothetical protein K502DRAFT_324248 [Neoconidiobolus thromboides FSU 785]|nr:hypothetical protein K502DRAFT_324248 [Neoconidiobolus thromboides FSU 785]